ncbi:MAG: hypothetical protein U5O16_17250 [Rhodococcus sp. (in: high G+C Gram-positive bacteria)]|uniref:hypothetical protein n=1 Tax=Rhodococcus sp. TaxID=1831 RepID=UPI002AD5D27F|nr:hypothetical protein [Rhodococcus sp. (in: high G+C Gram-positive bacteria)]
MDEYRDDPRPFVQEAHRQALFDLVEQADQLLERFPPLSQAQRLGQLTVIDKPVLREITEIALHTFTMMDTFGTHAKRVQILAARENRSSDAAAELKSRVALEEATKKLTHLNSQFLTVARRRLSPQSDGSS